MRRLRQKKSLGCGPDDNWEVPGWLWIACGLLSILFLYGALAGCSAVSAIDSEAKAIDRSALVTRGLLNELRDASHVHAQFVTGGLTSDPPLPDSAIIDEEASNLEAVDSLLDQAESEQTDIQKASSHVRTSLAGVEDKVPMWQRLVYMALVVLALVALIWLGTALGIFALIRRLLALVRIGIPRRVKTDAKLDAERFVRGSADNDDFIRIARRRDAEPAYDVEFTRAKRKAQLSNNHN